MFLLNMYVNPLTILKVVGVPIAKIALVPLPIRISGTVVAPVVNCGWYLWEPAYAMSVNK